MIYFDRITANAPTDVASQLWAVVSSVDAAHVQFEFHNSAAVASSITDIYFDDGGPNAPSLLGGLTAIVNSTTLFQSGANPPNLPSGSNVTPSFTGDFSAESANAPPTLITNGVDHATDSVGLQFSLLPSVTFSDVINALNANTLRVGLHVQGIPNAGGTTSDSFVSVPEPSAMVLIGLGGMVLSGYWGRRRRV
ncbi:MAG: PEP-CTERM sorting domain-containing protein [Pirellulales bacterium]|nr:PEP-CTERM sorting domain-containing protein [Pirellulales bacterium]